MVQTAKRSIAMAEEAWLILLRIWTLDCIVRHHLSLSPWTRQPIYLSLPNKTLYIYRACICIFVCQRTPSDQDRPSMRHHEEQSMVLPILAWVYLADIKIPDQGCRDLGEFQEREIAARALVVAETELRTLSVKFEVKS